MPPRSRTAAATGARPSPRANSYRPASQCGYHGLVFDGTGACVEIPEEEPNPAFRVRAYPVVERQHCIWVWMGEAGLADESLIVDFPYTETDDHEFFYGRYDVSANYMFMIDNLMDLTHLGYVHKTTIGGFPESPQQGDADRDPDRAGRPLPALG